MSTEIIEGLTEMSKLKISLWSIKYEERKTKKKSLKFGGDELILIRELLAPWSDEPIYSCKANPSDMVLAWVMHGHLFSLWEISGGPRGIQFKSRESWTDFTLFYSQIGSNFQK